MSYSQDCWMDRLTQWPSQEEMPQASAEQIWGLASLPKLLSPCPDCVLPGLSSYDAHLFPYHLWDTLAVLHLTQFPCYLSLTRDWLSPLSCSSACQPLQMLLTAVFLGFLSSLRELPVP